MIQLNVAGPGAAAAELAARAKAATAARQLEKWKQGYTKQIATLQTKVKALEGLLVKKDQLLSQCSKRSKRHHPTFRLLLHRLRKWLWRRRCKSKPAARKPNIKKRRQRWGLSFGQLEKIVDPLQACSNGRKWLEQRPDGSVDTASTRILYKIGKRPDCPHSNPASATAALCPSGKFTTWAKLVRRGRAPNIHPNSWKHEKNLEICLVTLGKKAESKGQKFTKADQRKGAHGTWSYAKVGAVWYEIYASFACGKRKKLTACELRFESHRGSKCIVRKQCGPPMHVNFWSVWALPHYPDSRGAYKKYYTAPRHFVKQALKRMTIFKEACGTQCAWY